MFLKKGTKFAIKNACGGSLQYEALLGDKTLDYLLVLAFHQQAKGAQDASKLHTYVSSRSNNDALREKMDELGLEKTGNLKLDASRVEQWVWKTHVECNMDANLTLKKLDPLLR